MLCTPRIDTRMHQFESRARFDALRFDAEQLLQA
jgi:hypothetical protein